MDNSLTQILVGLACGIGAVFAFGFVIFVHGQIARLQARLDTLETKPPRKSRAKKKPEGDQP